MTTEGGVDPTAALATAVTGAVLAGTGVYASWWGRRRAKGDAVATQIKSVVDASLALAEERRAGEHDCHEQLLALKLELRTTAAELTAKFNDCERRHAAVEAKLESGDFPRQHGPT